jgi:F420-dependent oxidoreductase-like protein
MDLSIQTPQFSTSMSDLVETWRAAARLGYRSGWLMDHLVPIVAPDTEPMLEGWTTLTALLALTEDIRGGVLVSANSFRHPAILARMAATVDQLSNGRLEVGIGAAWCDWEHAANGIEFPPTARRLDRLEEAVQVLRKLWTEPEATFDGAEYQLAGAHCEPKPLQDPLPILIGGRGERRTLAIVARYADRWNGSGSLEMLNHSVGVLHGHCEKVGRDPAAIALTVRNDFFMSSDPARVTAQLEKLAGYFGTTPDEARDRVWVGGPAELAERMGALRDAGYHDAIMCIDPPYDQRAIDMLAWAAEELGPQLR